MLGSREEIAAAARNVSAEVHLFQQRALLAPWDAAQTHRVLEAILKAGSQGEFRDYLAVEQAVMACELLLIDAGRAGGLRLAPATRHAVSLVAHRGRVQVGGVYRGKR